jgi:hypothetical protein
MLLGHQGPDLVVRGIALVPDHFIIKQKWQEKTLIPTVLRLLYDFLSLKNGASKSNKQKTLKKKNFLLPS